MLWLGDSETQTLMQSAAPAEASVLPISDKPVTLSFSKNANKSLANTAGLSHLIRLIYSML